jgi:hypothetical protein
VLLEKEIVRAYKESRRKDWSNQVPVASGLINATSYRRKAVDLVHQRAEAAFDLIELKVASNNPLYAAMEILENGLVWLLSRQNKAALGYIGNPIIEANDLRLVVLAPERFYELDKHLDRPDPRIAHQIGKPLDRGLAALGKRHGVTLAFQFQVLPHTFDIKPPYKSVLANLDQRSEL